MKLNYECTCDNNNCNGCAVYISEAVQADIDTIIYPVHLEELHITDSYIQSIKVPDGVKEVAVSRIGLRTLELPESLEVLYCTNNFIERIVVGKNIERLYIQHNHLSELIFTEIPTNLRSLDVTGIRLTTLDEKYIKDVWNLECYHNKFDIKDLSKILQLKLDPEYGAEMFEYT